MPFLTTVSGRGHVQECEVRVVGKRLVIFALPSSAHSFPKRRPSSAPFAALARTIPPLSLPRHRHAIQSGVERDALRAMWSAADPEGVGTLTRRSQFHSLLRLMAMSQSHLLPPLSSVSDSDSPSALLDALGRYTTLEVSLPTFSPVATPTSAFLISTYGTTAAAAAGDDDGGAGAAHAFSMATDAEFQRKAWMQQQQRSSSGRRPRCHRGARRGRVQCGGRALRWRPRSWRGWGRPR